MQDIPTTGAVAMSRNVWGSNQQIKVIAVLTSQINQPGMCRWIGAKRTEIPSTFFHIFSQLPILLLKTRTAKNLWECKKNMKFSLSFLWNVRKKAATITSWLGFERMKVSTWGVWVVGKERGGAVVVAHCWRRLTIYFWLAPLSEPSHLQNRPIGWKSCWLHV